MLRVRQESMRKKCRDFKLNSGDTDEPKIRRTILYTTSQS